MGIAEAADPPRAEVEEVVASFAQAATTGDVVAILDFDRTVTRCFLSDGGRCTSAHGVLEQASVFSEEYQQACKDLLAKNYPIEIDPHMSLAEKIPLMNAWYGEVHERMLSENVTVEKIRAAVAACASIDLREGSAEFLRLCQEASPPVPVLIMSAGLGDVIVEYLAKALPFALAPTTMVVSNSMRFDKEGRLEGFSEPLLHMFNKTAAFLPPAARELIAGKAYCLVVGDSVGDATMADGLEVTTLKVGLLSEKVEERRAQYEKLFDFVVEGDGPLPEVCFRAVGAKIDA